MRADADRARAAAPNIRAFTRFVNGNKITLWIKIRLILKVLVTTIDAQWEGMGDVGLARYELALLPSCPTITVLSYSK